MSNEPTPVFPLFIEQGVDFIHEFLWLGAGKFIAPIEHIEVGYPTIITVTNHGLNTLQSPQPIIISGVDGCPDLNSEATEIESGIYLDDDHFSMPVSTVADVWVPGTGEITYHKPTDLTGYTGEMKIRKNWYSDEVIHTISTALGTMILIPETGGITLNISAADTALFDFVGAVYDVDLELNGFWTRVFRGPVTLLTEITR
jgi:hypothetical protein